MPYVPTTPRLTRDSQRPDHIYRSPDGTCIVTPDGIGRYFYDDLAEAQRQHGDDLPVVEVTHVCDDDHDDGAGGCRFLP